MEKLEWIKIENFRAFKKAEISDFGDINVFIGKNNTGKSTLLESIYLNLVQNNRDLLGIYPFRAIFSRRGISEIGRVTHSDIGDDWDVINLVLTYLFYCDWKNFKGDKFTLSINSNLNDFRLTAYFGEFPEDVLKKFSKKKVIISIKTDEVKREYIEITPIFIIVDKNNFPIFSIVEDRSSLEYRIHTEYLLSEPNIEKSSVIVVDEETSRLMVSFIKRIEKYSKVDKEHLLNFISEQLSIKIVDIVPKIFDTFLVSKDNKQIPISLLGDGTKMALLYYYALSLENSYILLEEPENHLHPKLMDKVIDLIITSSQKNQIFITTHNLEFLQKILEKAYEKNTNLKVFAFENLKEGIPEIEVYECDEANAALNKIGVDLR